MNQELVVFVTVPARDSAEKIAAAVVGERLAACANIVSGLQSIYWWQGEVCSDPELLLIIKTTTEKYSLLEARIKTLHPYQVAEIIALPIVLGSADYLAWLRGALS